MSYLFQKCRSKPVDEQETTMYNFMFCVCLSHAHYAALWGPYLFTYFSILPMSPQIACSAPSVNNAAHFGLAGGQD